MDVLTLPAFLITYAVLQTVVFLLLIRSVDLYEQEPLSALAAMCVWGAVGATAFSAAGNEIVIEALPEDVATALGAAIAAPIVEEAAKGIVLVVAVVVAWWAHRRFGFSKIAGVTDGIVYGAAVGLGFAFTEDVHYLFTDVELQGFLTAVGEFASRRDFLGYDMLHHAIYSGIFGAGLGLATLARNWFGKIAWGLGGFLVAVLLHAVNNGGVQFLLVREFGLEEVAAATAAGFATPAMEASAAQAARLVGTIDFAAVIGFIAAMVAWLRRQREIIREELPPEVESGLIDLRDWEMVPRFFDRIRHYWALIRIGEIERARSTRRLHIALANLAFEKWGERRNPSGDSDVARLRQRVANLKAAQTVDVYAPTHQDAIYD